MYYVVDAKVIAVGLNAEPGLDKAVPVQIISSDSGMEAVKHLREHRIIDAVISRWDLPDMPDGELIRRIRAARPSTPTIVVLDEPYEQREVEVRALGVTAVLPGNVDTPMLSNAISEVLSVAKELEAYIRA